jgi:hypothetical protein
VIQPERNITSPTAPWRAQYPCSAHTMVMRRRANPSIYLSKSETHPVTISGVGFRLTEIFLFFRGGDIRPISPSAPAQVVCGSPVGAWQWGEIRRAHQGSSSVVQNSPTYFWTSDAFGHRKNQTRAGTPLVASPARGDSMPGSGRSSCRRIGDGCILSASKRLTEVVAENKRILGRGGPVARIS